jgi:hypothetical protein
MPHTRIDWLSPSPSSVATTTKLFGRPQPPARLHRLLEGVAAQDALAALFADIDSDDVPTSRASAE